MWASSSPGSGWLLPRRRTLGPLPRVVRLLSCARLSALGSRTLLTFHVISFSLSSAWVQNCFLRFHPNVLLVLLSPSTSETRLYLSFPSVFRDFPFRPLAYPCWFSSV